MQFRPSCSSGSTGPILAAEGGPARHLRGGAGLLLRAFAGAVSGRDLRARHRNLPIGLDLVSAYSDLLVGHPADQEADGRYHRRRKPGEIRPSEAKHESDRVANLSAQIIKTLQSSSHRGLATIGFILAVYTSFNLMNQIIRTLLFIFDDPRRPQEWSWQ